MAPTEDAGWRRSGAAVSGVMLRGGPPEIEVGLAAPEAGPRTLAPFGRRLCEVSANEEAGLYRLVEVDDRSGPPPVAGQFYMLATEDGWGGRQDGRPYLARAFSVCRVRATRRGFLVDAIGPGTARLATLAPGEGLWLVGPLGIGFTMPEQSARPLLVGGGIGLAPLVILAETLAALGREPLMLAGFRSAEHAEATRLVPEPARIATDDGSAGHPGLVTELLEEELDGSECAVYACGPPPMLEAVRRICADRSVPAQLALEEAMACGFGACFGCVVRTTAGYRRLCVDGPIVAGADLDPSWLER